jgi:hypothetical protein
MAANEKPTKKQAPQLKLGFRVYGKYLFRVRDRHLAAHLVPLIAARSAGAAKLDLVLRCMALLPVHAGKREPGLVLPQCSWELLHDLSRRSDGLGAVEPGRDPDETVRKQKRKWVGQNLIKLEGLKLVRREKRPGARSKLIVLRDDGTGEPLDDPDGKPGNSYTTILGSVIATRTLANWGASELAAYLAATVAERHESGKRPKKELGFGTWFRPLAWFADADGFYLPGNRVRMGFSVPTLERGVKKLEAAGLLSHERILSIPGSGQPLKGPRNLYTNNFGSLNAEAEKASPAVPVGEGLIDL